MDNKSALNQVTNDSQDSLSQMVNLGHKSLAIFDVW